MPAQASRSLALRAITRDGEPWFVAKDVCDALGMATEKTGTGRWLAGLDEDERNTIRLSEGKRGNPNVTVISESGMYALIVRSDKPDAKAFRKWVTSEVLPSIRKTGGYMTPEVAQTAVTDPTEFLARAILIANETIQRLAIHKTGSEARNPIKSRGLTKSER